MDIRRHSAPNFTFLHPKLSISGPSKILKFDQESGRTPLPSEAFQELGADYCSIGADSTYYQKLFNLGKDIYEPYLRGISDAAFSDYIRAKFEDSEGYRVSLLRFSGAESTIADAVLLFRTAGPVIKEPSGGIAFSF